MTTLTRRFHFSASHRLHSPELSEAENAGIYGKCNNPFGHGHNYILEVTVAGDPDPFTGLVIGIAPFDRFVSEQVLRLFAHRNINSDVPQFAALVPTTENVALVIGDLLSERWPDYFGAEPVRPVRVHLQETDRNGFELLLGVPGQRLLRENSRESVITNA